MKVDRDGQDAAQFPQIVPEKKSNLWGRTVTQLHRGSGLLSGVFSSVEGTDKAMKLVSFGLLLAQVKIGAGAAPVLSGLSKRISLGAKFMKLRGWAGVVDWFVQGRYAKQSAVAVASMGLLAVASTCETLMLVKSFGVNIGKVAAAVGRLPGCALFARIPITSVQVAFALTGVTLAAVAAAMQLKSGADNTKQWLKVADNIGKIGLITFSGLAFSYGFATLGIISSSIGLIKVLMTVSAEREEKESENIKDRYCRDMNRELGIPLVTV